MRLIINIVLVITLLIFNSCIQKTHQKTIRFKLDMSAIESPSKVGLRGEFGTVPWNETIYLTDSDTDGIYEGELTKQTGQGGMEFKFVHHKDQFELQGQNNRLISFEYKPEIIVYEAMFNNPKAKIVAIDSDKEQ